MSKSEIEENRFYFDKLSEQLNELPTGKIVFDDKPDIVIRYQGNDLLGIELTNLYSDGNHNRKTGSKLKLDQTFLEQLGKDVIDNVKKYTDRCFHLDIDFKKVPNKKHLNKIIPTLTKVVLKHLSQMNEGECLKVSPSLFNQHDFDEYSLKFIQTIYILTSPQFKISKYIGLLNSQVKSLKTTHIQTVISEKDNKLREYKPCDSYWLVMIIGGSMSQFSEFDEEKYYSTLFDRVFIFNVMNHVLNELKTSI